MPENIRENIFSPNMKTHRQGTSGEKGTGFGMPIVKLIMDQMHGEVRVESVDGKGTEFFLYLRDGKQQAA